MPHAGSVHIPIQCDGIPYEPLICRVKSRDAMTRSELGNARCPPRIPDGAAGLPLELLGSNGTERGKSMDSGGAGGGGGGGSGAGGGGGGVPRAPVIVPRPTIQPTGVALEHGAKPIVPRPNGIVTASSTSSADDLGKSAAAPGRPAVFGDSGVASANIPSQSQPVGMVLAPLPKPLVVVR